MATRADPVTNATTPPLKFDASFEQLEADEAETIHQLLETMGKIREKTFADTNHALRSVHAKSHGILRGSLTIMPTLPEPLRQGLFAREATYPVVMRLSSTPGDILPDQVSTPRGCAIKVIGVHGPRLPGSEDAVTQDFVMVNGGSTFQVGTLKAFLMNLKLLAAATDKAEGAKVMVSGVMKTVEKGLEAVGLESAKIKNMGGEPEKHILGETFFTQAPVLFGDYFAKLSLVPVSPTLKALTGVGFEPNGDPLALRHAVKRYFDENGGIWDLCAQLGIDREATPVEDASIEWPGLLSPYIPVARLSVPTQDAWSEVRSMLVDDGMSFSPWHGLAAHRPLGSIMRGRKVAYEQSAQFRAGRNGKPLSEPRNLDGFSS